MFQGGFAMFGMHLSGEVKSIVDSCTFQGLVGAVGMLAVECRSLVPQIPVFLRNPLAWEAQRQISRIDSVLMSWCPCSGNGLL